MKQVNKGASPEAFESWKALANDDWQPCYAELQNPEKTLLHTALLQEQGHVCCYCGRQISLTDSHIEHWRPQALRKDLELDYSNLLASCLRASQPGAPLHCGHAKGNAFIEGHTLSPLDPGCELRFAYHLNGAISAARPDDQAAIDMIALLQLDIAFLRNRRSEALTRVFDAAFLGTASDDELRTLATVYRQLDPDSGQHADFGHALALFAEALLPET